MWTRFTWLGKKDCKILGGVRSRVTKDSAVLGYEPASVGSRINTSSLEDERTTRQDPISH
jgi:hypothetical protein